MSNYNQLKNAAILTPTANQDLGSDANRYGNVYMTGNIVMSNGITVTSTNVVAPKIASLTLPGTVTAVDVAGGETVIITGSGFSNSGGVPTVTIGSTPASSVTYNSSTSITITTPALSTGTYFLYVVNTDGGTATYAPGISFSATPIWTTASGSLGTVGSSASASFTVAATGDPTITYAVKAGSSLPSGLSLNTSTGAITGTAPSVGSQTTYNFTLTATDGQNQPTDRSFSITVAIAPTSVQYMLIAGGGGGGGYSGTYGGGGGGAGGYRSSITGESSGGGASAESALSVSGGATFTVTIGAGGTGFGGEEQAGLSGTNSSISGTSISTLTAIGGGGGGGNSVTGKNGGSGGGGGNTPGTGTANQGYDGGLPSGGLTGGGGGGGAGAVGGRGEGGAGGAGVKTGVLLFTGTASIASNTTLTITAVSAGSIIVGTQVTGTGIPAGAYIIALGSGAGGIGTYTMNTAATATNSGVAISSTGRYHAGGGGGAGGTPGIGGAGGGGGSGNPVNGTTNTGGGGSNYLGNGGSGVVYIVYSSTYPALTSTTGSPTYTVENGYNVYRFTASGSFTI